MSHEFSVIHNSTDRDMRVGWFCRVAEYQKGRSVFLRVFGQGLRMRLFQRVRMRLFQRVRMRQK